MATSPDAFGIPQVTFQPPEFTSIQSTYDQQTDVVDTILGTGTAVIGDFAASVWNSLTPEDMNVQTEQLLADVSDNALNMYQQNEDFVHAASFIGGVFVPAGLALKGMKMARDGSKAVNWFSSAGKQKRMEDLNEIIRNSGKSSDEYKMAVRRLHAENFVNQAVLDNAAAEIAILGTMSAHPFMEDYFKDPVSSFSTSMLIGAGIVGPLSAIGLQKSIKGVAGAAQSESLANAMTGYTKIEETADASVQVMQWQRNIDNWENMKAGVGEFGPIKNNALTQSYLDSFILSGKVEQKRIFDSMSDAAIKELPDAYRDKLMKDLADDPTRFAGINKIGLVNAKEETNFLKATIGKLFPSTLAESEIPLTKVIQSGPRAGETATKDMVYSPVWKSFFDKKDLAHFGTAADLFNSADDLVKTGLSSYWHRMFDSEASIKRLGDSTAAIDAEYLRYLKAFDELPEDKLAETVVSPDELAKINGLMARLEKLGPEKASSILVTLTKNNPNWEKIEAQQLQLVARRAGVSTVDPKLYRQTMEEIEGNFSLYNAFKISGLKARTLLDGWKNGGGMGKLRNAVDETFRPSKYFTYGTTARESQAIRELYDSESSRLLREKLSKIADSNGMVWLPRGKRSDPFGSSPLESFTTNLEKAGQFGGGNIRYQHIHVKDILGAIMDIGPKSTMNSEILVMSPARPFVKDLPIASRLDLMPSVFHDLKHFGIDTAKMKSVEKQNLEALVLNSFEDFSDITPKASFKGTEEEWTQQLEAYIKQAITQYTEDANAIKSIKSLNTTESKVTANYADLQATLLAAKEADILQMLAIGTPHETISLRTNTPVKTIEAMVAGGKLSDLPNRKYTQASEIDTHLAIENRGLVVGTTANKIPLAQIRNKMNGQMIDDFDANMKNYIWATSQSSVAKSMVEFFNDPTRRVNKNLLLEGIKNIVPAKLGSKAFQSTDFALRDMGIVGEIASVAGKDMQHLRTIFTNQLLKPISDNFTAIAKDPAAVVEFNLAKEINAGLVGYREFRGDRFFVQDAEKPWVEVVDAAGKVIGKERNMVPVLYKGDEFIVKTESVKNALNNIATTGRELYHLNSTYRKTLGMQSMNDLGFWMPALNPRNKFITYVLDNVTMETKMLAANSESELELLKKAFLSSQQGRNLNNIRFVDKGLDQKQWNYIHNRHDEMFMEVADIGKFHGGSSQKAVAPTSTAVFSEMANAYEHYIHKAIGNMAELHYSDVMHALDTISDYSRRGIEGQPLSEIQKAMTVIHDPARVVKNTILGKGDLQEYTGWAKGQNYIVAGVEYGLQQISKVMAPILETGGSIFGKGKIKTDKEYEALTADLKARGIPNPFEGMDDVLAREVFAVEKLSQAPNMTPRLVALSNNFAATALLKVMELGQPLVNMLSMPILTSAAIQRQFRESYMGAQLDKNFHLSVTKSMYEGVRYLTHPDYQKYKKLGTELGIFTPVISEVNELMMMSRSFNPGVMQGLENALNSKTVELLSAGSIWAEKASREFAFATGVVLAKKAYPGLGDHGVMTFARNFVDTAIGNYSATQRPVMFQGTLGVAMGLFQTYMVTLMQQIYRRFELRDWKALAKMTLAQSSIFGVKSLPGFNQVSETIGEKFSDQNYDLTTGTYRALDDDVADLVLYGLPSQLGPSVYSRGDIQPRIPNIAGGLQNLAAVNILNSAYDAGKVLAKASAEMGQEGVVHPMMEALSVQSISRPLARMSELYTGHAITRKGNEVANADEIYSTQGLLARIFATRSLRESKAREATYLHTMYGSLDRDARTEATKLLKGHIRAGTLDPDTMERIMEKYMRTGSPQGWRAAVKKALVDTDSPGVSAVRNHLAPDSPAQLMIEDID